MKNNNLDNFISNLESIKMTQEEKNKMRSNLELFASTYTPVVSPYHKISLVMRRSAAFAFIAIISVGSLSSLASNNALPNDVLYPVKIAHEEIKLAATFDTKKKINYEIKRTEKRIQEATTLASQSELDSETQGSIAQIITQQTAKVQEHINEVKSENPEEALILNSEFKSTIKVNKEALRKVTTTTERKKKVTPDSTDETSDLTQETAPEEPKEDTVMNSDVPDKESKESVHEDDYEDVETSSAENLLSIIGNTERALEEFDSSTTEEIEQEDENKTETEVEIDTQQDVEEIIEPEPAEEKSDEETIESSTATAENSEEEILDETEMDIDTAIAADIKSLEEIKNIKERITNVKKKFNTSPINSFKEFDEQTLFNTAEAMIENGKFNKAFIIFETILGFYNEQVIVRDVEKTFGISLEKEDIPQDIVAGEESDSKEEILSISPPNNETESKVPLEDTQEEIEKENLEIPEFLE